MKINFNLNGKKVSLETAPGSRLLDVLREHGLFGVKEGCGDGNCGACMVLMDGRPVNSCLVLAPRVHGREVTTIEGLGSPQNPHPLQDSFVEHGAVQCGFCTPGSILSSYALLKDNPNPTDAQIKRALDGNYCRCTGYVKKFEAVKAMVE